jgi:predicted secreted protein
MAVHAHGTLLKIGDGGGPETFTTIEDAFDIAGPTTSTDIIDVTTHSSPSVWREKLAGLIDPGEITFSIYYTGHATQDQLRTDALARTYRNFQLLFAPLAVDETIAFSAYVTRYETATPNDGAMQINCTLTIGEAWTWT